MVERRTLGQNNSLSPSPAYPSHTRNITLSRIKCEIYFYKKVCSFVHWSSSLLLTMFLHIFVYVCGYTTHLPNVIQSSCRLKPWLIPRIWLIIYQAWKLLHLHNLVFHQKQQIKSTDLCRYLSSNLLICNIINIYRNLKTRNWFKYETFIHLFEFKGFSTWERERERHTIFLCWLLLHRQLSTQPTHGAHSTQSCLASPSSESQPSSSEAGTQLTAFSQIPKSSAHASGHDVIHLPSLISYLGISFWHLWMTHPPRVR